MISDDIFFTIIILIFVSKCKFQQTMKKKTMQNEDNRKVFFLFFGNDLYSFSFCKWEKGLLYKS